MQKKKDRVFIRTMGFLWPYKVPFFIRLFLTVLNAGMGLVASYGSSVVVRAAQEKSVQYLWQGTVILAVSLLVEACSLLLSSRLMAKVSYGSLRDIRNLLVEHLMKAPATFYADNHSGDISSRMTNDVTVLQNFISGRLTIYLYYPIRFLAALLFLGATSLRLTVACCLVIPVSIYLPQLFLKKIEAKSAAVQSGLGQVNESVEETISGVLVRKCFGSHDGMDRRFENRNRQVLEDGRELISLKNRMNMLGEICGACPTITCCLYGAYLAQQGSLEIYQLSFFVFAIGFLVGPVRKLPDMLEAWKKTKGAAARILAILDEPDEAEGSLTQTGDYTVPVALKEVSFAYEENPVLRELSLEGKKNQLTAVVGPSGCGKSTLLSLLGGFYAGYKGEIILFGNELHQWRLADLRRHIGFVFQEAFLFPGTVYENIAMGKEGATKEEVILAAQKANAHDFIRELENGYDTMVGERGARLSGGQKQRITIARALLKDAPLLLLDEPTSALDVHAEKQVQEALERLMEGRTIFMVAHRMSTILHADQILVLEDGRIADRGTHEQLLERCDLYRSLYQKETQLMREEAYE